MSKMMAHPWVDVADSRPIETVNRPDEWKIEQGLHGAKLPFLDQTGDVQREILPRKWAEPWKDEEALKALGNFDDLFKRETEGWKGSVTSTFPAPSRSLTYGLFD